MTTTELLEKAKELGLVFTFDERNIVFYDDYDMLGLVAFENYGAINTNQLISKRKNNLDKKLKLLEWLYEYSTTPLEERGDPRRYKLKTPVADNYLYVNPDGELFLSDTGMVDNRNVFTQPEIDSFPNQYFIKTMIKELVEEE